MKTAVTVYHVIWYTLLFSLYLLKLKINILEYKMSYAKLLPFNFLMHKNWNSNCLKLSVNNIQRRATIVALVPWRNFFFICSQWLNQFFFRNSAIHLDHQKGLTVFLLKPYGKLSPHKCPKSKLSVKSTYNFLHPLVIVITFLIYGLL